MLPTLLRRAAIEPYALPKFPSASPISASKITAANNPYQSKRSWPPDFTKLSQKHQFRLERRYRRRAKLKWARPNWTKFVKLAQWGSILGVVVYGVLFMEVGDKGEEATPFERIREWYKNGMEDLEGQRDRASTTDPRAPIRTFGHEKDNAA